jgi:hypothetical protein
MARFGEGGYHGVSFQRSGDRLQRRVAKAQLIERGLEGSLFGARIEVELIQDRLPKRLLEEGAVGAFAVVMLGVAAEIGLEDPSGADGQEVLVDYGIEPEISVRDQRLDRARKVVAANGLDAGPGRRIAEEGKPFRAQSRPSRLSA